MDTKSKLIELLSLCIDQGLQFDYTPQSCLSCAKFLSRENGFYFKETVWLISEETNIDKINYMIEKVKNYKKQ